MAAGSCGGILHSAMDEKRRRELLSGLLRTVSRSFYLSIRVLPEAMRVPVGTAYLLARAADTIADARAVAPAERAALLADFRGLLAGKGREGLEAPAGSVRRAASRGGEGGATAGERALLDSLDDCFRLLDSLPQADGSDVRSVVGTLTAGMEMDLRTFPPEDSGEVAALETVADLDRYTYLVAGCVGPFWTRLAARHVPALRGWKPDGTAETAVRFGQALQMTNILRDCAADLRIGRCYIPREVLDAHRISPGQLPGASGDPRATAILQDMLRTTLDLYSSARRYVVSIPASAFRIRLACMWPAVLGLGTLEKLALAGKAGRWPDFGGPVKVSRGFVYRTMMWSLPAAASDGLADCWVRRWMVRVARSLDASDKPPPFVFGGAWRSLT